jgi:hypothetical protein
MEKWLNEFSIQMEQYYEPFERWIENSIFPTKMAFCLFSDITNRKKTELVKAKEKAEQSDRLNQRFWLI